MNTALEQWLPIVGYSYYEVSDQGQVRTTRSKNGRGFCSPRLLTPRPIAGKPYLRVTLTDGFGRQRDEKVHLLVLNTFAGHRPSRDHDGCHKDGNAKNNHLSNLYWGTKKENANDRIRHGTQLRGEQINTATLSQSQVKEIIEAIPGWKRGTGKMFAKRFGVSNSTISSIKNRNTWGHL